MKLLKTLEEMHAGVHGLDNFDRAVDMINSAVDHHERNDNFDAIADVEGLVQFLKGQFHDFTPALEDSVREIIADELGHDKPFTWGEEEEEEKRGPWSNSKLQKRGMDAYYTANGDKQKRRGRDEFKRSPSRFRDRLATKSEEEEYDIQKMRDETKKVLDDSRKRKMARKYSIHGPSRRGGGIRRRDLGKPRGTFGLEQEEQEVDNWHVDWNSEVDKFRERSKKNDRRSSGSISSRLRNRRRNVPSPSPFSVEQEEVINLNDRRQRRRLGQEMASGMRGDTRGERRRGHRHSDSRNRHAQLMARKARPHVSAEQEEIDWNLSDAGKDRLKDVKDTDWNKEVDSFRKRRKTVEPKYARRPSRLSGRRRQSGPASGAFNVRFESFKQFNEMYRDSQHGLTVDLSGPEGNAFVLLGYAKQYAKQLEMDGDAIVAEMQESDYDHLVATFEKHFGSVITLINKPGEETDDWDE